MQRYGRTVQLRPGSEAIYTEYHAAVWPGVLATIAKCNIRNYSIYRHGSVLFSYFEYHGTDFAADMRLMAADPETQRWWTTMGPFMESFPDAQPGELWTELEEVFHVE